MGLFSSVKKAVSSVAKPVIGAGLGYAFGGVPGAAAGLSYVGAQEQNEALLATSKKARKFARGQQRRSFDYATESQARSKKFSRKMSNTAYERAMRDMKRSGLNPILAYQQGGASTPTVSAPAPGGGTVAAAHQVDELANVTSSAISARQNQAFVKQAAAQLSQTHAGTDATVAGTANTKALTEKAVHDAKAAEHNVNSAKAAADLKRLEAERFERSGDSVIGRQIDSLSRYFSHLRKKQDRGGNVQKGPLKITIRPGPTRVRPTRKGL